MKGDGMKDTRCRMELPRPNDPEPDHSGFNCGNALRGGYSRTRASRDMRPGGSRAAGGMAALLIAVAIPIFGGASAVDAAPAGNNKMLIIYYSWGGNTRYAAEQIQSLTGADIFELKTVDPYPAEYRPTTEQAKRELNSGHRPQLAGKIDNLADYGVVFIGSPNWWGTLAMPFFTFLEANNLSGKTIVPFMTHGGSGFGRSLADLEALCPNAAVLEGLAIRAAQVRNAQEDISRWLKKIGVIQ